MNEKWGAESVQKMIQLIKGVGVLELKKKEEERERERERQTFKCISIEMNAASQAM